MHGTMTNEEYKRYKKSLKNTPGPVKKIKSLRVDYKGLLAYAEEKNVYPSELSKEEQNRFIEK